MDFGVRMTSTIAFPYTGDLHLGLSLRRVSREEEQQRMLGIDRAGDTRTLD